MGTGEIAVLRGAQEAEFLSERFKKRTGDERSRGVLLLRRGFFRRQINSFALNFEKCFYDDIMSICAPGAATGEINGTNHTDIRS